MKALDRPKRLAPPNGLRTFARWHALLAKGGQLAVEILAIPWQRAAGGHFASPDMRSKVLAGPAFSVCTESLGGEGEF